MTAAAQSAAAPTASGVLSLTVEVTREAVLRGLGYGGGRASERVLRRLDAVCAEAAGLLDPRGAWRVVEGTRAAALGVPAPGRLVGVAVCTVGPLLEAEATRRSADGSLLDALLLDAVGSVAAEAAAEAVNREVCAAARLLGVHAGPRSSPGYPGWALEHQRDLLALLPAAKLGVSLTEGLMMVPGKSVSFAVPLHDAAVADPADRCSRCERRDCTFRSAPA